MNEQEISEIKSRAEKATPGPWHWKGVDDSEFYELEPQVISALGQGSDSFWIRNPADRDLIQNCRTDIPALLCHIDTLKKENEFLQANYDNLHKMNFNISTENTNLRGEVDTLNNEIERLKASVKAREYVESYADGMQIANGELLDEVAIYKKALEYAIHECRDASPKQFAPFTNEQLTDDLLKMSREELEKK